MHGDIETPELELSEKNLTLILANQETDNSILIGADSLVVDSAGNSVYMEIHVNKLHEIQGHPMAWAYCGTVELGNKFETWLKKQYPIPQGWDKFEILVRNKVADINKEQRNYVERSGAVWSDNFGLSCLFAGWLENKSHMIIFDDDGTISDCSINGVGAIGSGKSHAIIAYETLYEFKDIPKDKKFHAILRAAIVKEKKLCGLPLFMWRITPNGIDKLENPTLEQIT